MVSFALFQLACLLLHLHLSVGLYLAIAVAFNREQVRASFTIFLRVSWVEDASVNALDNDSD